jgi:hypothetical protein
MNTRRPTLDPEIEADPFSERTAARFCTRLQLLGARILFECNDRAMLRLVNHAFAALPRHRLASTVAALRIKIVVDKERAAARRTEPAPLALMSAGSLLGGATSSSDCVMLAPRERTALVVVSPSMRRYPYHVRYELIEFAALTLAARVQRLVSLHAACVGLGEKGVILMGPSGAGKSTAALHCLLDGFDFLSEDSVFVSPRTLRATGIASFLHMSPESLRWLGRSAVAKSIRSSPMIRRRSGARKYELDLRRQPFTLAKRPLQIVSIVFLSSRRSRTDSLLNPLSRIELIENLAAMQAYGASQPQWREFIKNAARIPAFELRRGHHPVDAARALRTLLCGL